MDMSVVFIAGSPSDLTHWILYPFPSAASIVCSNAGSMDSIDLSLIGTSIENSSGESMVMTNMHPLVNIRSTSALCCTCTCRIPSSVSVLVGVCRLVDPLS